MANDRYCPECGCKLRVKPYYDDTGRLEEVAMTCKCGYEWIKSYGRETERHGEERE